LGRSLEFGQGGGRQVVNDDDNLAVGVLEAREVLAHFKVAGWLKPDPRTGRKYRIGG
jgi:hypothetical protein